MKRSKEMLFGNKINILGVLHRGTDYKTAQGHYIQPSIEQTLQKTSRVFQEEKFDYIFLCTEEQKTVDEFYKIFSKDNVLVSEVYRIQNYDKGSVPDMIRKKTS